MRQLPSVEAVLGTVIDGKYRLDSLIGLGGMGRVFSAIHLQLNKTFALKLMSFPAQDSPQLARFKREAEALGKIRHPNVVGVTDFGITSSNVPYIVMEYIHGLSLRGMMERQGCFSERQTLMIIKQVCAGLYAAHLQGIVHRDLKPENIMIEELADGDLIVRVLDFSIAKLLQIGDEDENISDHEELLGTVKYMTPEQFLGNAVDARSDIFGICLLTYEMLAGIVPPATVSLAQPLKELRPDISIRLSEILQKGLSSLPENRQQSALELKREFESLEFVSSTDASTQYTHSPNTNSPTSRQNINTQGESSSASLELVIGQKLSYYQVIKKLGEGGMGEVYLAEDSRLGRKVALKLLPTEIIKDPNRVKRFEQEARTASALNHPNILTIYEIGDAEGIHFIATEFIDGPTLRQKIIEGLSIKEALKIAIQIANALAVAHPAGVVHRDIKPGNIMLREDGYVKILDFGLAKFTETDLPSKKDSIGANPEVGNIASPPNKKDNVGIHTEAGKIMGTPKYMSPEQARGQVVDARTDIFSFGVVLYQMITSKLPFDGATNSDIIVAVLEHDAPPISQYLPGVSPELERIIAKALRKDREERYQTIKDMLLDLKSLKQRLDFEKELTRSNIQTDQSITISSSSSSIPSGSNPSLESELAQQIDKTDSSLRPIEVISPKSVKKSNKFLAISLATLLLIGVGSVVGYYVFYPPQVTKKVRSLAILPFRNLKNDPDADFLSFSLADSIINKLGYIDSLTLRPSSAINKYRNQEIDSRKVAAELNVNTLLIGNFVKEGDELRINAQLIDVDNDEIIWGDTLDLKYEKLLTVQTKVADQIVRELEIKLTADEAEKLKRNLPSNPIAYEYCLRGIDLMNLSANNYQKAQEVLEKSTQLDPNYALTWTYLGLCYASRATAQFGGQQEYDKAQRAYDKALELDPEQIESRLFSAKLLTDTGHVEEAVQRLRKIIDRKPRHAAANWQLSYAYRYGGMLSESIEAGERALDLDKGVANDAFNSYFYDRQYKKFIDSLPAQEDSYFIFYRGFGYYYLKDMSRAKPLFEKAYQLTPNQIFAQIGKAFSFAIDGNSKDGIALLKNSEEKIKESGVSDGEAIYKIAQAYAVLGDKESALATLRLSVEKGFFCYPYFVHDSLLDNIRSESGFSEVMEIARKRHEDFKNKFF